jgi:lipoate-protein ligase A
MPRPVDVIVQPSCSPRESLAADRVLLEQAKGRLGVLRIHAFPGDVLSLGRYHAVPPPGAADVTLWRRLSGGRPMASGDGFVGVSLVLPHRSALVADDPLALTPPQVLNRCVRGLLEACKLAGVAAFYPGRDAITVNQRIVGLVSLEVDDTGASLFEAIVAVGRDFSLLPALLDRVDPGGVVKAGMLFPHDVTSLAGELGGAPAFAQVVKWLCAGYVARLDVECRPRDPTPAEREAIAAAAAGEFADARWLGERAPRPDLDRCASLPTQLGVLEVHFALTNGAIRDVVLTGDFIAGSGAVARLERALRGCPAEVEAVAAVIERIFAEPGSFLLGVTPLRAIAEAIGGGLAA